MSRTVLNPWDWATPRLKAMGYNQDQIDELTLDELGELWESLQLMDVDI